MKQNLPTIDEVTMLEDDFELDTDVSLTNPLPQEDNDLDFELSPKTFSERETVVKEQELRKEQGKKLSPNSKIIKAYRSALPAITELLQAIAVGLILGDISIVPNADKTAYSIKFE